MYLMGFDAAMGEGKTLGMSLIAQHYRQRSGCTLYSNYGLANSKVFTTFQQFLDVAAQPSSIICLDEIHNDLDSRSSNTNVNKYLSHMIYYLRKIRATIMFASPDIMSIDIRVRNIINVYCRVRKDRQRFHYKMWDMQSSKYLRTIAVDQQKVFAIAKQIYDDKRMVLPMEFPEKKEEYLEIIHMLKNISDNFYEVRAAMEVAGA
ncbi:zonular occludens toxin domain-containing protein [Paenibacillus sp. FSL R7-0128]|uniref:zonular occludens toxin domain-containing protein n=1 Tax=Paenibacillus sp. FSL R7-0128 TaxID=2954529 RepID=UPI0030F6DC54